MTPIYLLHTEKRRQTVLPYVFIMAYQTSPLEREENATSKHRHWLVKYGIFTKLVPRLVQSISCNVRENDPEIDWNID